MTTLKKMAPEPFSERLLQASDPEPVELINQENDGPIVLVCEHAGQTVPRKLRHLGLPSRVLDLHIGWDIGAAAVTRYMAERLQARAVLQRYSRLVIDCNRPPAAKSAIPTVSDAISIAGNEELALNARRTRVNEVFMPFSDAVATACQRKTTRLVLSIHTFTPVMAGISRPWDIGFLYRKDGVTAATLASYITAIRPTLNLGFNEPYKIDDESDWFVPVHAEPSGLPHSLIEIRNDHVSTVAGQKQWADLLADASLKLLEEIN